MDAKQARRLLEPIQHKLGLVKNYVDSLHGILPLASVDEDDGEWSVNALSGTMYGENHNREHRSKSILRRYRGVGIYLYKEGTKVRRDKNRTWGAQLSPEHLSSRV